MRVVRTDRPATQTDLVLAMVIARQATRRTTKDTAKVKVSTEATDYGDNHCCGLDIIINKNNPQIAGLRSPMWQTQFLAGKWDNLQPSRKFTEYFGASGTTRHTYTT